MSEKDKSADFSKDSELASNDERMMDSATKDSIGTVEPDSSKYVDGDDVANSIAEGYF